MQLLFGTVVATEAITDLPWRQLALLNEGICPACGSIEGFSSMPKSEGDPFATVTVINDAELLEKSFEEGKEQGSGS